MKKTVLILIAVFSGLSLYGQSDAILTQQWLSRINCNPAATGNTDDLNIFLLHRTQWSGFEGEAPQTTLLNATNYFSKINSGVGLSLSYDKEGNVYKNFNVKAGYAYHLKLSDVSLLSLGLGLNLQQRSVNYDELHPLIKTDAGMPTGKESKTGIDFDFGLEFNTQRFTLGASLNRIGKSDIEKLNNFKNGQQIYSYARYRITLSESIDIAPTLTYVYANHTNLWESGLTGFFADKFWAGAAYRHDVALAFMVGFEFNIFRVGYAYDHYIQSASDLGGIHEVMLSVKLPHKK
jgi:type IX secretion system PorP/SprF family membrane protein